MKAKIGRVPEKPAAGGSDESDFAGRLKRELFGLIHGMLKCQSYPLFKYLVLSSICCLQLVYFPLNPLVTAVVAFSAGSTPTSGITP